MTKKNDSECVAELIIHVPNHSAKEIAPLISTKPTRTTEKGEYQSKTGEVRTHEGSQICFESPVDKYEPVEGHIQYLLNFVENHKSEFDKLPVDCEFDIWCTISSKKESGFTGITLANELINRASKMRANIVLSIWGNEG